jgi:prepilin-type processing-associated H-X9-DG protein
LPGGYYGIESLLLTICFSALARVHSLEGLQSYAPGEWGKVIGLDRVPEVRTLRIKIGILAKEEETVTSWRLALCQEWLNENETPSHVLYVDGHVRVYHGDKTTLPRHYVARQRLCLRATVDYWINSGDGQPYFKINQAYDPGLLTVLTDEIVPHLEKDIPGQPDQARLEADPLLHRFTIVFDREGYSPKFLAAMKAKRIACLTYRKGSYEDWPAEEFAVVAVTVGGGRHPPVEMMLAERGVYLAKGLWVREVRRLTQTGHQTAVLSTDYRSSSAMIAAGMFARWSQENYFRYARQHFDLDGLASYQVENVPETARVVNPVYRDFTKQIDRKRGELRRKQGQLGKILQQTEPSTREEPSALEKKLKVEIKALEKECDDLKEQRHGVPSHIRFGELPEEQQFKKLNHRIKSFMDTIKMIAYRAETALVSIVRDVIKHKDEARTLIQSFCKMTADILPDPAAKTLTVRLHHSANRRTDAALIHLCDELNATETIFPRTDMVVRYQLVSSHNLRDPEV